MARIKTFMLEPTGEERATGKITEPLYRDSRTGALVTFRDAEPGAMVRATWWTWARSQDDGAPIMVKLPGSPHNTWCIDERASNCTRPDDDEHHCWVRHGAPPDLTVDKSGNTCAAGAGSILAGGYHGFLRGGYLED